MYEPSHPILLSSVTRDEGGLGLYEVLHSNGSFIRDSRGDHYDLTTKRGELLYSAKTDQGKYSGKIADTVLVRRIMEYMDKYWGKKITNCSSLAHFLTSGTFVECEQHKRWLVIECGMRAFEGQKVCVGDTLCILYGEERLLRSRKARWRGLFLKSRKWRFKDGTFTHALAPRQKTFTPQQIREIYDDARISDYHFLVCVAMYNGMPVWISQRGCYVPGEDATPVVFTVGHYDGYCLDTPFLTLIKKRR